MCRGQVKRVTSLAVQAPQVSLLLRHSDSPWPLCSKRGRKSGFWCLPQCSRIASVINMDFLCTGQRHCVSPRLAGTPEPTRRETPSKAATVAATLQRCDPETPTALCTEPTHRCSPAEHCRAASRGAPCCHGGCRTRHSEIHKTLPTQQPMRLSVTMRARQGDEHWKDAAEDARKLDVERKEIGVMPPERLFSCSESPLGRYLVAGNHPHLAHSSPTRGAQSRAAAVLSLESQIAFQKRLLR